MGPDLGFIFIGFKIYVKLVHKTSLAYPLNLKRDLLSTLRAPSLVLVGAVVRRTTWLFP